MFGGGQFTYEVLGSAMITDLDITPAISGDGATLHAEFTVVNAQADEKLKIKNASGIAISEKEVSK